MWTLSDRPNTKTRFKLRHRRMQLRWKEFWRIVLGCAVLTISSAHAQDSANLFRGKTVRVIVGASAGGGFDTYSRIIAEHLGTHLPGRPTVIVQNMAGAGSLTAANYIANVAPKDGTVIGAVNPLIGTNALFYPDRFKFDARTVTWIG